MTAETRQITCRIASSQPPAATAASMIRSRISRLLPTLASTVLGETPAAAAISATGLGTPDGIGGLLMLPSGGML
jgi:hypothetical protein